MSSYVLALPEIFPALASMAALVSGVFRGGKPTRIISSPSVVILVVLWMGIYPSSFLDVMAPSVERLIGQHKAALQDPDGSWWHRLGRQLALNDPTSGGAR